MEVAEPYVKWQDPNADEVEETAVELMLERKPRNQTVIGSVFEEEVENEDRSNVVDVEEDLKVDEVAEIEKLDESVSSVTTSDSDGNYDKESLNTKNVYFDETSGTGLTNGTSETQQSSVRVSVSDDTSMTQSSEVIEDSITIQETHTVVRTLHKTNNSSIEATIKGNGNGLTRIPNEHIYQIQKEDSLELGDLLEGDPEPKDYNLEAVLQKQETHDLICPNCQSCITRRVILKKRKRVIKDTHLSAKRDKLESEISQDPARLASDQVPASVSTGALSGTDDQHDVITCWSCFSLLIPSGNGFKLFNIFGDGKRSDVNSASNSNQTPLLTSETGGDVTGQGNNVHSAQLGNGNIDEHETNTSSSEFANLMTSNKPKISAKKGGDFKLFWSYGNSREDTFKSSQQKTTNQTGHFFTLSEKAANAHGKPTNTLLNTGSALLNHVEVNTVMLPNNHKLDNIKQGNSLSFSGNGLPHVGSDFSTTQTAQLAGKSQLSDEGSNELVQTDGLLDISYKHEELEIKINEKPVKENEGHHETVPDNQCLQSEDIVSSVQGSTLLGKLVKDLGKGSNGTVHKTTDDVRILIENGVKQVPGRPDDVSREIVIPVTETQVHGTGEAVPVGEGRDWDILKSIVYGGLIEAITSLEVVSSAAGAETATLNVLALGLANLIGGLIIIFHNLKDLRKNTTDGPSSQLDRYIEVLGRRANFKLHAFVVVLSFLIFGIIPILVYGFTFRKSDNRDYKSLAVLGASIICITLLSLGKAHIKNPPRTTKSYFSSIFYYLSLAIAASGLSYIAGKLLQELIEKTGWFDSTSSLNSIFPETMPSHSTLTSY